MSLEKYEGRFYTFAEVFNIGVRDGVVVIEQYSEGEFPIDTIKTEAQYSALFEMLTGKKLKPMKAYILIEVFYDHFRFQRNVGVFYVKADAERFAIGKNKEEKFPNPIFCYNENYQVKLDNRQKNHWQIQEIYIDRH